MITREELIQNLGMADEDVTALDEDASLYESGVWPAGRIVRRGRPSLPENQKMKSVTFRIEDEFLQDISRYSKTLGISQSEFIRLAIREKLAHCS